MKSVSIIFILFFSIFSLHAQIVIQSSDLPSANDTVRYSIADPTSISNVEASDTNYIWNFPTLKLQSQALDEYKASNKTPYAFYFIGASKFGLLVTEALNLGVIQLTKVYDFFENTSSVFQREGMGMSYSGFPLASYYTNKDEVYQFPLEYGDRDSSTFHFTISLPPFATYSTSGYRINEVDGWGKITTPYGTFECIRLKTTLIATDTITFSGMPVGFPNNSVEYKWLAKDQKFPILEVKGTDGGMGFIATEVNYRDVYHHVYDPTAVVADFKANDLKPNTKDTVSFTNQSKNALPLSTYTWSFTPKTVEFVHETDKNTENPDVVFKQAGKYSVKLEVISFNSKHDTTKIDYIIVNKASGIDEHIPSAKHFVIYPNPANTFLRIFMNKPFSKDLMANLLDHNGKLIKTFHLDQKEVEIDVTALNNGIYFIQFIYLEGVIIEKFVKE